MNDQNQKWFTDKGDETRALDWPIDHNALVWEIGGFEGRWARQMVEKYDPFMEIFEPQSYFARKLHDFSKENDKVKIHEFGLWVKDTLMLLHNCDTDGASVIYRDEYFEKTTLECAFYDVYNLIPPREAHGVDVCLMNIEGGEFALLPYMIGMDMMKHFRFFWCQFHPGLLPHGDERANEIFKGMLRTHKKIWDYYPTAVAWERK